MKVYLVQHGEARSETEDPARPLSDRGRVEVERVAGSAAALRLSVAEIVRFRNAAIVCLLKAGEGWLLQWILTPELAT